MVCLPWRWPWKSSSRPGPPSPLLVRCIVSWNSVYAASAPADPWAASSMPRLASSLDLASLGLVWAYRCRWFTTKWATRPVRSFNSALTRLAKSRVLESDQRSA